MLDLLFKFSAAEDITIIMIEHIMHAVMRFSTSGSCVSMPGKIVTVGAPVDVMANPRVQEAYLGA